MVRTLPPFKPDLGIAILKAVKPKGFQRQEIYRARSAVYNTKAEISRPIAVRKKRGSDLWQI